MRLAALAVVVVWVGGCATGSGSTAATTTRPPTVKSIAVAPLQLSGDPPVAPASLGAPGTVVEASYHVCLDATGAVVSAQPAPGNAAVDDAALAALRRWSWFVVSETARPCFDVPVHLAVPARSRILRQAGGAVVARAVDGPAPRLPPWLIAAHAGRVLDGAYKVCVGDDGVVQSARPLLPIAGAGDAIGAALRASRWDVVVGPLATAPYCFAASLRIDLRGSPRGAVVAPNSPFPPESVRAVEPGRSVVLQIHRVDGGDPHLSDAVRIAYGRRGGGELVTLHRLCFDATGAVVALEALSPPPDDAPRFEAALRSWRFFVSGPPGVGFCQTARLVFTIGR